MNKNNIADQVFTAAYLANLIGRSFKKIPSFSAADAAMVLTSAFMREWDKDQETHIDSLDEFFMSRKVQVNLKELMGDF